MIAGLAFLFYHGHSVGLFVSMQRVHLGYSLHLISQSCLTHGETN